MYGKRKRTAKRTLTLHFSSPPYRCAGSARRRRPRLGAQYGPLSASRLAQSQSEPFFLLVLRSTEIQYLCDERVTRCAVWEIMPLMPWGLSFRRA